MCDGVPDFRLDPFTIYAEIEGLSQKLESLLCQARTRNWFAALAEVFEDGMVAYATDERKADFLYFLELEPGARVLEVGCGLGPIVAAMAREFREVYAIDIRKEQSVFVQLRAQQEGLDNVHCSVGGAECALPYRSGHFDLVVLNGVIEWVGSTSAGAGEPARRQDKMLREVHRVLKPRGQLYLATKNRFALRYLMGMVDEHTGLRFTSILPERVRGKVVASLGGKDSGARLLSKSSLRRMLRAAGFTDLDFWIPLPDFRHPNAFVREDGLRGRALAGGKGELLRGLTLRESLVFSMLPARMLSVLPYCFAVVSRKGFGS